jgi:hypothetical protein
MLVVISENNISALKFCLLKDSQIGEIFSFIGYFLIRKKPAKTSFIIISAFKLSIC